MAKESKKIYFPDLGIGEFFTGKMNGENNLMVKTGHKQVTVFASAGLSMVATAGNASKKWPVERVSYIQFQTEPRHVYENGEKRRTKKKPQPETKKV